VSVTLQIELPEREVALLLEESDRQGLSLSELLRRLLRRSRDPQSVALAEEHYANDPLWAIAGLAQTGTTDASANHDQYLYDQER